MANTLRMEESLSRSFDYLSSASPTRIRKGLRQLEGTLAQICLSKPIPSKRQSMLALGSAPVVTTKNFEDLKFDHAYQEFFKLQQNFQWNITMRLISCLERLLGRESNGQNDLLVIQSLDLIHGVLLLHPPSRELFAREIYMNVSSSLHTTHETHLTVNASSSSTSSTLKTAPPSNHPPSSPSSPPSSTPHKTRVHSSP